MPLPIFPTPPFDAAPQLHGGASASEAGVLAKATRIVRQVVALSFVLACLLALGLVGERWRHDRLAADSIEVVKQVQRLTHQAWIAGEQRSRAAQRAVDTGDTSDTSEHGWLTQHASLRLQVDQAVHDALALAGPDTQAAFEHATRPALAQVLAREQQALQWLREGRPDAAHAALSEPLREAHVQQIAEGLSLLATDVQQRSDDALAQLRDRSWLVSAAALALFVLAFAGLRQQLGQHLARVDRQLTVTQEEVTHLALHDALTGLANRRHLRWQMESAMARGAREAQGFAVLVMDLDGFKPINDRHGHPAGDEVLVQVAERMSQVVRPGDVVARLGGDEFVVMLQPSPSEPHGLAAPVDDTPLRMAQRLVAAVSRPIRLSQGDVAVSASVGIALYPSDADNADDLLRRADVALYRAKAECRGDARFFEAAMDEAVRDSDALKLDLRIAIERQQIEPYFQPLVNLSTGALTGFEVLARWRHATRGMISPLEFVKVAEDSGQIDALTVCVMRQALTAAREWEPHLSIAINIAPQQLKNESLVDRLLDVLRETHFPAERFEIEITENALIADLPLARRIVNALKARGIRVALDDFGTGYSSLAHLSELPFDKIKIDRSFIHSLRDRHESATIVHAIIGLGKSLNLPTAAEGIESAADADLLAELGCHVGQGFHYSKPVPAGDVQALIDAIATASSAATSGPSATRETAREGEDSALAELA